MTELGIPELSLVCLVGASGSGKSTFARQHFGAFEVVSRWLVSFAAWRRFSFLIVWEAGWVLGVQR